jgi:urea carboxylase
VFDPKETIKDSTRVPQSIYGKESKSDRKANIGSCSTRRVNQLGFASTIEYTVDDATADFYFPEMNTRLQVEHGITELCYDVDLVELMLKQANAQLSGRQGLESSYLDSLQPSSPRGSAIE